jgi:DNA-binding transcriptional ArsR family regulator
MPTSPAPTIGELQVFKAEFFRALAHPVRIRLLEELGARERTVQDLQSALGVAQPLVSQQLAVLRGRQLVSARKVGATMVYSLRDPLLTELLAVARRIFDNHLTDTAAMLRALRREKR